MRHLTNIQSCSDEVIEKIISSANAYFKDRGDKSILKGKIVANLFFENSTRTLASFDIAAQVLGAKVVALPMQSSSVSKGESFYDTVKTVDSMGVDFIVIRHSQNGWPQELENVEASIINAGEGTNAHPTQALADYAVIKNALGGTVSNKKISICGDLKHSRVTSSNVELLSRMGANITLGAPAEYKPSDELINKAAAYTDNFEEAISGADIVMMLRNQNERHNSQSENSWCLDEQHLKLCPEAKIMHPGPVNRDVELSANLIEHPQSLILQQVKMGVAVRKAVFELLNSSN